MTKRSSIGTARRMAYGLAGLTFVLTATPVLAEDFGQMIFGPVMGIFGRSDSKAPIDYEQRAPLALPPTTDLPPPGSGVAAGDAAWPNDPDEMARLRREAEANAPRVGGAGKGILSERLTPEELADGRLPGGGLSDSPMMPSGSFTDFRDHRLSPAEMKKMSVAKKDPAPELGPDGMPVRHRLVEPPSEYRVPAATAEYDVEAARKAAKEKDGFVEPTTGRIPSR